MCIYIVCVFLTVQSLIASSMQKLDDGKAWEAGSGIWHLTLI